MCRAHQTFSGQKCRKNRVDAERLERRLRPIVLILIKYRRALAAGKLERDNLFLEFSRGLRREEALLRAQRPFVLRLAADPKFLDD